MAIAPPRIAPLRIAMVSHEFTITGTSVAFHRLSRHLRSQGHALTIVPLIANDGPMKERYLADGFSINPRLAAGEFDLVVGTTICAAPVAARVGPHLPMIWLINEAEVGLNLVLKNPDWIAGFHHASAIVYNMASQRDVYRSFTYALPQDKLNVMPYGVDIDRETIDPGRVAAKQRALRVVQLGTIETRKRPGDLLLAVQACPADYECAVVGKFYGIRPEAQALAEADPERYRLLSGIGDQAAMDWVASADVFCLASASETQGLAVYEAALLERPLLLTDLPCYEGVFRHGRNCVMVPVGDIEMMAASLAMLASSASLRARLGAAARQAALPYGNDRFHADFDRLIADVMRRRLR
jgi:glycosyltransferase involved in cell wall biosynthesis